jgi:DNA-binding SARP family transcriptional activator
VTLHRLRRLLGDERFILYGEGVLSLNQQLCWVDVWAFNRHVGQGRTLHNRGSEDLDSAISAFQKAISLYNGNFLAGDARSPWAFSMREVLRGKMIQIITTVGHCWEEAGDWRKAVESYLKGLETDDLVEEYYQRLMVCHQRMGDRGAALSVYKRCSTALAMSGFKPSSKTKEIYETLVCCSKS